MRLGTDTGNISNFIMSGTKGQPAPAIGMGGTALAWTDRYAGTITSFANGVVQLREDIAIRTDDHGMSAWQAYRYEPNLRGRLWYFRQDRDGSWRQAEINGKTNRWRMVKGGTRLRVGERISYHDYSF